MMENPLDKLGNTAEKGGQLIGEGLRGVSGFLNDLTGDAVTAAIFGGFLLLFLTIFKAAASSKQPLIYARAVKKFTFGILLYGFILYSLIIFSFFIFVAIKSGDYPATLNIILSSDLFNFVHAMYVQPAIQIKWYLIILIAIHAAASIVESAVSRISTLVPIGKKSRDSSLTE